MIELKNLSVSFTGQDIQAVSDISLKVEDGEHLAILGETGSGKSVLLLAILRLLPQTAAVTGRVLLDGTDLASLSKREIERVRLLKIGYLPQGSGMSLNPLMPVGFQVAEKLLYRGRCKKKGWKELSASMLERFQIRNPREMARRYPHEFSGGMKQRALLAMGMAGDPPLILADEPTKGLDQENVQRAAACFAALTGKTLLCVTHDLRFAKKVFGRVAVLYAGNLVENGPAEAFFLGPLHPYAKALCASLPENGLQVLAGFAPPHEGREKKGCSFFERCPEREGRCTLMPPLIEVETGWKVRCWRYA